MSCFQNIISSLLIALTLFYSTQVHTACIPGFEINSSRAAELKINFIEYNFFALIDQKQSYEKISDLYPSIVKYTLNYSYDLSKAYSSKIVLLQLLYFLVSKDIVINLTSFVITFPFHVFG